MTDPTEPLPPEAMLSVVEQVFQHLGDEWDQTPLFGFLHAPPLQMAAALAEQEGADVAEVRGLMAAPMPLSPEAWEEAGDPALVLAAYADAISSPDTDHEKELIRRLRQGPPVMGAWMVAEAWAPPERMQGEYSRARAAGQEMDLSALGDRREARIGWIADAWGRDYVARQIRGSDQFEYDHTEPGGHHLSRMHPMLRHLRAMVDVIAVPLPA